MEWEEKLKEAERQMKINGGFTLNLETKQQVFLKNRSQYSQFAVPGMWR